MNEETNINNTEKKSISPISIVCLVLSILNMNIFAPLALTLSIIWYFAIILGEEVTPSIYYLSGGIIYIIVSIAFLLISIWNLIKNNKVLRIILIVFTVLIIIIIFIILYIIINGLISVLVH